MCRVCPIICRFHKLCPDLINQPEKKYYRYCSPNDRKWPSDRERESIIWDSSYYFASIRYITARLPREHIFMYFASWWLWVVRKLCSITMGQKWWRAGSAKSRAFAFCYAIILAVSLWAAGFWFERAEPTQTGAAAECTLKPRKAFAFVPQTCAMCKHDKFELWFSASVGLQHRCCWASSCLCVERILTKYITLVNGMTYYTRVFIRIGCARISCNKTRHQHREQCKHLRIVWHIMKSRFDDTTYNVRM